MLRVGKGEEEIQWWKRMGSILEGRVFEHDEGVEVDGQRVAGVEVHIVPASGGHQVLQEECARTSPEVHNVVGVRALKVVLNQLSLQFAPFPI